MILQIARAGIVGGKHRRVAVLLVEDSKVSRARQYVVARIVGILAKPVAPAHLGVGSRHQLHEAHGAGPRPDRPVTLHRATAALHADHRTNPAFRYADLA